MPSNDSFQAYLQERKQIEDQKVEVFVPLNLQPTNSQNGLYQQILTYQLEQMQSYGLPTQQFQQWNGRWTVQKSPNAKAKTGDISFQFQPIITQGSMNLQDIGKFSINHQIFLHQTEFRLTPANSRWSLSHVKNPEESKDRVMYGIEW